MRPLLLATRVLAAAVLISPAFAQVRSGAAFGNPLSAPQVVTPGFASFGGAHPGRPGFVHRPFAGGSVFWYSDLAYEPATTGAPVSVIVVQPAAAAPAPAPEPPPSEKPLVLELQGDHWVRLGDSTGSSRRIPDRKPEVTAPQTMTPISTLLVFRDGRTEPTSGYVIIGDQLYAQSDYWSTGSWTKKIPLAALDLAKTMSVNQARGSIFRLPASPNEVVLRP